MIIHGLDGGWWIYDLRRDTTLLLTVFSGSYPCFARLISRSQLFPTCQVRVVRFYQSCSPHPPPSTPPPPPPLPPPPGSPRPCLHQLRRHSTSTSALPTRRQSLRQLPRAVGTAGPSDLSGHGWTSTARFWAQWALLDLNCKGLSALGTAGPQPGTFRAQWAPLDLNLGPCELSGHRWTSTWNLPSSVGTAGPQRPDRMPEDMPDRMPVRMSDRMPEGMPDRMSDRMPEDMPEDMPEHMPKKMPGRMPEDMPDRMPEDMPDKMPEDMPEDLPVTKRINVMVGMTRSKVTLWIPVFSRLHPCFCCLISQLWPTPQKMRSEVLKVKLPGWNTCPAELTAGDFTNRNQLCTMKIWADLWNLLWFFLGIEDICAHIR